MTSIRSIYEPQVDAFRATAEAWKADHDAAMACRDLEGVIRVGNALYDLLVGADRAWRLAIARGRDTYSAAVAETIDLLFSVWSRPAKQILSSARRLVEDGYEVEGLDEYAANVQQAEDALL